MVEEKKSGWKEAAETKIPSGEVPIQNAYSFSYIKRSSGAKGVGEVESYEKSIKDLGEFKTVQGFWRIYNHLIRPNDLSNSMEYHLFKAGIKPMWEDPANRKGGKWTVRVRKGISSRYWEDLILAIIGEQFDVGNEICGAVVSIRYSEDVISLWNRNADNGEACSRIRDTMRKVLNLPHFISLEYRRHDTSLTDTTAARNANTTGTTNAASSATNASSSTNDRNGGSSSSSSNSAWRDQRSDRSSSNQRDGASQDTQGSRDRGNGRFTRGNSDRNERGDRSERGERGDRSASSNNSRNAWSRDNKRPIFTKAESGDGSSRTTGEAKKSPRNSPPPPNAWQK